MVTKKGPSRKGSPGGREEAGFLTQASMGFCPAGAFTSTLKSMWKALWYQLDLILTDLWARIPGIWNWGLFKVDKNAVTLGQILVGLLLLVLGYYMIRKLTRHLETYIFKRMEVQESISHAVSTFVLYLSMVILILFTLRLLNIPITVFTVIGGAIAVGVGLGSQNILNNFISGLVVILEQPIRPGDIVEMDGLTGEVERIGARATRIRSIDNTHIVVPNSSFLEKNILNWTLSDSVVRRRVDVGVIYGSPTRKVKDLLQQAVKTHPMVLSKPVPVVFFTNFGNNSLEFSVSFWIRVKNILDLRTVPSDIRFLIDDLFRKNRIVIAFPQKDLHFRTPLEVRLKDRPPPPPP